MHVIGGRLDELTVIDWRVIPVPISSIQLWHEFSVVPELPLEVLISNDILEAH